MVTSSTRAGFCCPWRDPMLDVRIASYQVTLASTSEADLILTDPPYAISRQSGFAEGGVERFRVSINYGETDALIDYADLVQRCALALRGGGSLVAFCDTWRAGELRQAMIDCRFAKIRLLTWIKPHPVPRNLAASYRSNAVEHAVCGVKPPGSLSTFNAPGHNGVFEIQHHTGVRIHPNQKPLALMRELVHNHSNAGDLVVDPFMGSGTTGVAALGMGRNFRGGDVNPDVVDPAKRRLRKEVADERD